MLRQAPGGMLMLEVSEIFHSIQGEGTNMGEPAIFLRLAGCNLDCEWCDTKYAREGEEMTMEDVGARIISYHCNRLVITGGEPMLQNEEVLELVKLLEPYDIKMSLETNGTIAPTDINFADYFDYITVSPKIHKHVNRSAINYFKQYGAVFKFVVGDTDDLGDVHTFCSVYNLDPSNVILMPLTFDDYKIGDDEWIVEHCKRFGFRYSPRLQVLLWGYERGK